jgi:hypothetical protein
MKDLHLSADVLLGLGMWFLTTGFAELVIKPAWRRVYRRVDQAAGDRLPDLK